jgi:hypothetical protein
MSCVWDAGLKDESGSCFGQRHKSPNSEGAMEDNVVISGRGLEMRTFGDDRSVERDSIVVCFVSHSAAATHPISTITCFADFDYTSVM